MHVILTVLLAAAAAVTTGFSVTVLPYYDDRSGEVEPLVWMTLALWILFFLSLAALKRVPEKAVVALVLAGSVAIGGAAMLGPPNTSTDSARYAWDGIVQNAGISPYEYAPADPALEELRTEWLFPAPVVGPDGELTCTGERIMKAKVIGTDEVLCTAINRPKVTTIYPPASEIVFAAVRAITGPAPQYWPVQLLGLLVSLGTTVILLRALVTRGRDPRWAALWGWCPLVATEGITNSHIDMVPALLLLVATLLIASPPGRKRRPVLAGLALGVAISTKLIPVIGSFALLRRHPVKIIVSAILVFALLYVPYVLASGIDVLGYLPGYLGEEGYSSGKRFILVATIAPGPAALVVSALLIAVVAALVWRTTEPEDPWFGQLIMIGTVLLVVTPHYPWYALLLIPMIAMTGRWEWMAVPLAITERLLFPSIALVDYARVTVAAAVVAVVVISLRRAGAEFRGFRPRKVTER